MDNDTIGNIANAEHVNKIVLLSAFPSDDGSNDSTEDKTNVAITNKIILVFYSSVHYI